MKSIKLTVNQEYAMVKFAVDRKTHGITGRLPYGVYEVYIDGRSAKKMELLGLVDHMGDRTYRCTDLGWAWIDENMVVNEDGTEITYK